MEAYSTVRWASARYAEGSVRTGTPLARCRHFQRYRGTADRIRDGGPSWTLHPRRRPYPRVRPHAFPMRHQTAKHTLKRLRRATGSTVGTPSSRTTGGSIAAGRCSASTTFAPAWPHLNRYSSRAVASTRMPHGRTHLQDGDSGTCGYAQGPVDQQSSRKDGRSSANSLR